MQIKDDKNSTRKVVLIAIVSSLAIIVLIILLVLLLTLPKRSNNASSSDEPSSSELSSSEEPPSSEEDPYIDDLLSNLISYTNKVHKDVLLSTSTVKEFYSFNIYTEDESTHIVYAYTTNEDIDRCFRMIIDIGIDISNDDTLSIIHNNELTIEMFLSEHQYEIVEDKIASKEGFKELYSGDYSYSVTYKDDYDHYYFSGIGIEEDGYTSIDYLSFDKDSFVIDSDSSFFNSSSDKNNRYYQLLEAISH